MRDTDLSLTPSEGIPGAAICEEGSPIHQCVESLDIPRIGRHLFLCADQTKPKCCPKEAGVTAWDYLKRRLKELKLDRTSDEHPVCVFSDQSELSASLHSRSDSLGVS